MMEMEYGERIHFEHLVFSVLEILVNTLDDNHESIEDLQIANFVQ